MTKIQLIKIQASIFGAAFFTFLLPPSIMAMDDCKGDKRPPYQSTRKISIPKKPLMRKKSTDPGGSPIISSELNRKSSGRNLNLDLTKVSSASDQDTENKVLSRKSSRGLNSPNEIILSSSPNERVLLSRKSSRGLNSPKDSSPSHSPRPLSRKNSYLDSDSPTNTASSFFQKLAKFSDPFSTSLIRMSDSKKGIEYLRPLRKEFYQLVIQEKTDSPSFTLNKDDFSKIDPENLLSDFWDGSDCIKKLYSEKITELNPDELEVIGSSTLFLLDSDITTNPFPLYKAAFRCYFELSKRPTHKDLYHYEVAKYGALTGDYEDACLHFLPFIKTKRFILEKDSIWVVPLMNMFLLGIEEEKKTEILTAKNYFKIANLIYEISKKDCTEGNLYPQAIDLFLKSAGLYHQAKKNLDALKEWAPDILFSVALAALRNMENKFESETDLLNNIYCKCIEYFIECNSIGNFNYKTLINSLLSPSSMNIRTPMETREKTFKNLGKLACEIGKTSKISFNGGTVTAGTCFNIANIIFYISKIDLTEEISLRSEVSTLEDTSSKSSETSLQEKSENQSFKEKKIQSLQNKDLYPQAIELFLKSAKLHHPVEKNLNVLKEWNPEVLFAVALEALRGIKNDPALETDLLKNIYYYCLEYLDEKNKLGDFNCILLIDELLNCPSSMKLCKIGEKAKTFATLGKFAWDVREKNKAVQLNYEIAKIFYEYKCLSSLSEELSVSMIDAVLRHAVNGNDGNKDIIKIWIFDLIEKKNYRDNDLNELVVRYFFNHQMWVTGYNFINLCKKKKFCKNESDFKEGKELNCNFSKVQDNKLKFFKGFEEILKRINKGTLPQFSTEDKLLPDKFLNREQWNALKNLKEQNSQKKLITLVGKDTDAYRHDEEEEYKNKILEMFSLKIN